MSPKPLVRYWSCCCTLLGTVQGIFPECTGMAPLPRGPEICYAGPKWGITLTAKIKLAQNRSAKEGDHVYSADGDNRNYIANKEKQDSSTDGNVNQSEAGVISLALSWGAVVAQCPDVAFQHQRQTLLVDLEECLPGTLSVAEVKYCSDQDNLQLEFDKPLRITVYISRVLC
eukprot:TRINITY_DN29843_c0_g1_i1.p1 TRINITY_DN29843_c0_g1~~TRINITY_DN29843_c0_g1_i1.p1  ORF type:complete len:182 (-),score=18.69 TRINITY_DN29843_c0_g1_i1:277-792(-)